MAYGTGDPIGENDQKKKQKTKPRVHKAIKYKIGDNKEYVLPTGTRQQPVYGKNSGQKKDIVETCKRQIVLRSRYYCQNHEKVNMEKAVFPTTSNMRAEAGLKKAGDCAISNPMKKAILFSLFLLLVTAVPAQEIRGMAGMNWSKYLFSSEITNLNRGQKTGFTIGCGWVLALKPTMHLQLEAVYSRRGSRADLVYPTDKLIPGIYENTSLGIPVLFKYKFREKASPYAALGPEFVFLLAHHLKIPSSDEDFNIADNTKKFILSYNLLLGYEWPMGQWGLFAEVRYSRWLTNFLKDPSTTVKSEAVTILLGGVFYL